jgi:hypothetical protein
MNIQILDRGELLQFSPDSAQMQPAVLIWIGSSRLPTHQNYPTLVFAGEYDAVVQKTFDNTTPQQIFNAEFGTVAAGLRPMNADHAADIVQVVKQHYGPETTFVISEYFGKARAGSVALAIAEFYEDKDKIYQYVTSPAFFANGHILKLMRLAFGIGVGTASEKARLERIYYEVFGGKVTPNLNGIVS